MKNYLFVIIFALLSACSIKDQAYCGEKSGLSIINKGTENPVLMYDGKPMLKVGSMPEVQTFAFEWGSSYFKHEEWTDWMISSGLGYGRVYPEHSFKMENIDNKADKKIFPFKVEHWNGANPVVDLHQFDPVYWEAMANTIKRCREKGIVLHLQLYQRCYFGEYDYAWEYNFFNPKNNINNYNLGGILYRNKRVTGYGIWKKMLDNPELWKIHEGFVLNILNAIGGKGNVFIDLMNEAGEWNNSRGGNRYGMYKEWVERTIDVIERWEKETGNDILVGMFEHAWGDIEYVNSHPRLELLIYSAVEIHSGYAGKNRIKYKKPAVSVHNNAGSWGMFWPWEEKGLRIDDHNINRKRMYQWLGMMQKVQGLGVYGKHGHLTDLNNWNANLYASQSKVLLDFFNSLEDYAALLPASEKIAASPCDYEYLLASDKELVIYLHTKEYSWIVPRNSILELKEIGIPDTEVEVKFVQPYTGKIDRKKTSISGGSIKLKLPHIFEDIAVHIIPKK